MNKVFLALNVKPPNTFPVSVDIYKLAAELVPIYSRSSRVVVRSEQLCMLTKTLTRWQFSTNMAAIHFPSPLESIRLPTNYWQIGDPNVTYYHPHIPLTLLSDSRLYHFPYTILLSIEKVCIVSLQAEGLYSETLSIHIAAQLSVVIYSKTPSLEAITNINFDLQEIFTHIMTMDCRNRKLKPYQLQLNS